MKARWVLLFAIITGMITSCNTIERRIEKHPERFNGLSPNQQSLVREGKIEEGMSQDAVYFAFGEPDHISEGRKDQKVIERWTYLRLEPVMTSSFGLSYGPGWIWTPMVPRYYLSRRYRGHHSHHGRHYHSHGSYVRPRSYYRRAYYPHYYYSPEITYRKVPGKEIYFENQRVVGWQFN